MVSHDACTHEKTKSGRAACRAGKAKPATEGALSAVEKLRKKAAHTSTKVGRPKSAEGDSPAQRIRDIGPFRGLFASGLCGEGHHGRCTGQYTLTPCSCPCHKIAAEDAD